MNCSIGPCSSFHLKDLVPWKCVERSKNGPIGPSTVLPLKSGNNYVLHIDIARRAVIYLPYQRYPKNIFSTRSSSFFFFVSATHIIIKLLVIFWMLDALLSMIEGWKSTFEHQNLLAPILITCPSRRWHVLWTEESFLGDLTTNKNWKLSKPIPQLAGHTSFMADKLLILRQRNLDVHKLCYQSRRWASIWCYLAILTPTFLL